jgi:hypothetical protein
MLTIKVTQCDINRGKRAECGKCPVAIAIKRATGENRVVVGAGWARVGEMGYPLPDKVYDFIERFDFAKPVKPIRFALRKGVPC